jgi:hypothetical protein
LKVCARPEFPSNDRNPPAAILAADVVGYSRLMGEHKAVTARRFANIAKQDAPDTLALRCLAKTHRWPRTAV